jgi:pyruvate formate lyase activating enzyme
MKDAVKCTLCPRECVLAPSQRGDCRVRINYNGKLVTLVYGKPVSANPYDPVEKKPLFHFLPGTRCFSIATAGCNLHCKFCQNYEISQMDPEDAGQVYDLPPEKVVQAALMNGCKSIAYTYSDPTIFFEYTRDTQIIARERGIRNILVTASYINEAPLKELNQNADAANIDLKAFSDDYYRNVCGGTMAPVLRALEVSVKDGVWVEMTNLIVPTLNDDLEMIKRMCGWVLEKLGPDVPLHFSRFYPLYKLTHLPQTPADFLATARETTMAQGINFVYIGNVRVPGAEDTICPGCKNVLIGRQGYAILSFNIKDGKCASCGRAVPGVWR